MPIPFYNQVISVLSALWFILMFIGNIKRLSPYGGRGFIFLIMNGGKEFCI